MPCSGCSALHGVNPNKKKLPMAAYRSAFPGGETRIKIQAHKLKVEQYAKSRARVKVLEDLEGGSVNSEISCNSETHTVYNPVYNKNIESGMVPARKCNMPKKFEIYQQNLESHQAPMIKATPGSAEPTDMLCKLCTDMLSIITSWHCSEKLLRVRS